MHQDDGVDELVGVWGGHDEDGPVGGDPPGASGIDLAEEDVEALCEYPEAEVVEEGKGWVC